MRSVRFNDGNFLYLHPEGEALSDAILRNGDYWERNILDYISDKYPVHGTIVDVGANIGNHTKYFETYLDYKEIVAYEAVLANFVLLEKNITAYNKTVFPLHYAISDSYGTARMFPNLGNMGASEIREDGTEYVEKTSLDREWLNNVTLIKIDVEWHEPQVIEGAKNLIARDKPLILLEDANEQYLSLMHSIGYTLEIVWPEHKTYLYKGNI